MIPSATSGCARMARQVEEVDRRVVDGDGGDAAVETDPQAVVPRVCHRVSLARGAGRSQATRRLLLDRALARGVASPRARRPSSSARGLIPVPGRTRQEIIAEDVRDLARLGYAQQLFREMGGFSNFAISFSIISVLTGAVLLTGTSCGRASSGRRVV